MKSPMKSDGWLYLVRDEADDDVVKIGYAKDPHSRLQGLQTGSASRLRLSDKIPGTLAGERALHEAFSALRLHHEWFRDREVIEECFEAARERILDLAEAHVGPHWTPDLPGPETVYLWIPYDPAILAAEAAASIAYHDYGRRTGDWEGANAPHGF
jgi:hypothetical protein